MTVISIPHFVCRSVLKIVGAYCTLVLVFGEIGPGGLRAPPEVAFAMRSWPLLLPTFTLLLAQAALNEPPEVAFAMSSWQLLLPTFSLSFPSFAFDPLRGNSRG